jgi:hypothetical protein
MSAAEHPFRYVVTNPRACEFPLDMLRHDVAEPATPEDFDLIRLLCDRDNDAALTALPRVVRVSLVGKVRPTVARWESFDCAVFDLDGTRILSPEAEHQIAYAKEMEERRIRDHAADSFQFLAAIFEHPNAQALADALVVAGLPQAEIAAARTVVERVRRKH